MGHLVSAEVMEKLWDNFGPEHILLTGENAEVRPIRARKNPVRLNRYRHSKDYSKNINVIEKCLSMHFL